MCAPMFTFFEVDDERVLVVRGIHYNIPKRILKKTCRVLFGVRKMKSYSGDICRKNLSSWVDGAVYHLLEIDWGKHNICGIQFCSSTRTIEIKF